MLLFQTKNGFRQNVPMEEFLRITIWLRFDIIWNGCIDMVIGTCATFWTTATLAICMEI